MLFITSNQGKFAEVKEIFEGKGIKLERKALEVEEARGSLEEIAMRKALSAYAILKEPLFVEDAGLFIPYLNGFPGEFSAWVVKKIGIGGILSLLSNAEGEERRAYFKAVIAFTDGKRVETFEGRVEGYISTSQRGEAKPSLPYDTIFIPKGYEKTFAEDYRLKASLSHRKRAAERLISYLLENNLL